MRHEIRLTISIMSLLWLTACGQSIVTGTYTPPSVPNDPGATAPVDTGSEGMEDEQGEEFLHNPGIEITFNFVVMPGTVLGIAYVPIGGDGKCPIELSQVLDASKALNKADREMRLAKLLAVVRHEVGHCFGLEHYPDDSDVMNAFLILEKQTSDSVKKFNIRMKQKRHHDG